MFGERFARSRACLLIESICARGRPAGGEGKNSNKGLRESYHHWCQSNHLEMSEPETHLPFAFSPE